MIKSISWDKEITMDFSDGSNVITRVFMRGRHEDLRIRKCGGGTTGQGRQTASRSWAGQKRKDSLLHPLEEHNLVDIWTLAQ